MRLSSPCLALLFAVSSPAIVHAQDLGFLSTVFARVHRLTLSLQSISPKDNGVLDLSGRGCGTLPVCGAGTEVLIDLDTRSRAIDLELGFGAGYLRPVQSKDPATIDLRASLRSLPVISIHSTYKTGTWINPYFTGSFGLVDLWNGRVHTPAGKQAEVRASTFEYGVSAGVGIAPPFTNARLLLAAGYRARNFASVGYSLTDPLPSAFPRSLDLSAWQFSAGWQFDLRPLSKSVDIAGSWVLARVDGLPLPFVAQQRRTGSESTRDELLAAYLELSPADSAYSIDVVTRRVVSTATGAPVEQQVTDSRRETGRWSATRQGVVTLATGEVRQRASRSDDELMVEHASTGRRLFFRRVRRS
ncbi:MAG: hypothetical protein IPK85_14125 [Gemmatimonadetes bacterium]|nr:hypothetical protein [Gemmatimonadota bacterium]